MADEKKARDKERAEIRRQIKVAEDLTTEHLECRVGATRHRWARVKPLFTFDVGTTLAYQCDSCLTIKHTATSPKYGEQLRKPVYIYPEGYELKGSGGITPAAVRAATLSRLDLLSLPDARPVPHKTMEEE